jgi:titin
MTFEVMNVNNSGTGSLRQAIDDSNDTSGTATNLISFDITASGVQTIALTSGLPAITHPVVIDGTTQPGYSGTPSIALDGIKAGGTTGLFFLASRSTVKGLAIINFELEGIRIQGVSGDLVTADYVGVAPAGNVAAGNEAGVEIKDGAHGNQVIGNVISGNDNQGVIICNAETGGTGSYDNLVEGNLIGTDASGKNALGNDTTGVEIEEGSAGNTIGGPTAAARNIIAANGDSGVAIVGPGTTGNLVEGNDIGTGITGTHELGNGGDGVHIDNGSTANTIGGTATGTGNLISGNDQEGVHLDDDGTTGNFIVGNKIGTDVTGTVALGNSEDGVLIEDGSQNIIGGVTAVPGTGAGNLISGNLGGAVSIEGSDAGGDVVQGNLMGTNAAGTKGLGNGTDGVYVADGASDALIGGLTTTPGTGAGNVMADNAHFGVHITGGGTTGVVVEGNIIGLNAAGTAKLGNAYDGVLIDVGASKNTIGGVATGAGNVISGNREHGVDIDDSTKNLVEGNLIGTDVTGLKARGNTESGVLITNKANSNTIGGTTAAAGNVVSANGLRGVHIQEDSADNLVEGNDIGTNVSGAPDLGNDVQGVLIDSGSSSNTIGGTASGAGNVIADNHTNGVELNGAGEHNLIEDDTIDADGSNKSKTNPGNGVSINDSPYTSVIGCTIDNNPGWGILITSSGHVTQKNNSFSGNGKGNVSG